MEELRVKIKLDFKDFLDFQYLYLRKKFITKFTVIGLLLLFISALFAIISGIGSPSIKGGEIAFFSFILLFPVILIASTRNAAKKLFYSDPILQKEQEYIFNSSGICFSNENSQTKLTWDELHKYDESKNSLLIYCSPLRCFILPKKQLSESEILFIRNKIASNIKSKNVGTNSPFSKKFRILLFLIPIIIGASIALFPNKSNEYFEKGYAKAQQEDYEGAIIEYTKAIEEDDAFAKAYNFRGYAKGMIGDYTGELEDCSKAIDLDKNYGGAYYNRADAKYYLDDSVGACIDFHKADDAGFWDAKEAIESYCK